MVTATAIDLRLDHLVTQAAARRTAVEQGRALSAASTTTSEDTLRNTEVDTQTALALAKMPSLPSPSASDRRRANADSLFVLAEQASESGRESESADAPLPTPTHGHVHVTLAPENGADGYGACAHAAAVSTGVIDVLAAAEPPTVVAAVAVLRAADRRRRGSLGPDEFDALLQEWDAARDRGRTDMWASLEARAAASWERAGSGSAASVGRPASPKARASLRRAREMATERATERGFGSPQRRCGRGVLSTASGQRHGDGGGGDGGDRGDGGDGGDEGDGACVGRGGGDGAERMVTFDGDGGGVGDAAPMSAREAERRRRRRRAQFSRADLDKNGRLDLNELIFARQLYELSRQMRAANLPARDVRAAAHRDAERGREAVRVHRAIARGCCRGVSLEAIRVRRAIARGYAAPSLSSETPRGSHSCHLRHRGRRDTPSAP